MATLGDGSGTVVGRNAELAALDVLIAETAAGRGRAALLEGEPGIGKSALLDAALGRARAAGLPVHAAVCPKDDPRPLAVLCDALGLSAAAPAEAPAGDAFAVDDPVAVAARRVLARVERLCAAGPLVLAVDDLQDADDASLLVWQRLCASAGRSPLLLLAACRPVPRRTGIERVRRILEDAGGLRLPMRGLGADHAVELVARMLGGAPGPLLAGQLEEAAGNPLYLRELTDSLVRAKAVTVHGGAAELSDGAQAAPGPADAPVDALAVAMTDRLGFLGEPALEVLRAAALLGTEFAVTDLSLVLGRSAGSLAAQVQEAITAGVLDPSGSRLRFRHGLLRQSLNASVPGPLRIALRHKAIRALMEDGSSVPRVAELLLGDLDALDGDVTAWIAENATCLARQAPYAAMDLFTHALRCDDIEPQRRAVLRGELIAVLFRLARYGQAAELSEQILAENTDVDIRGKAGWFGAHALMRLGRAGEATQLARSTANEPAMSELWSARLTAAEALTELADGRTAEAEKAAARAVAAGERLADPMTVAFALYTQSTLRLQAGDATACAELADQALLATGNDARLTELRSMLESQKARAFAELDRFGQAEDALRAARALAERSAEPVPACCRIVEAEIAYLRGTWDEAIAVLDASPEPVYAVRALIAVRREGTDATAGLAHDNVYSLLARALAAERDGGAAQAAAVLKAVLEPAYGALPQRSMALPALVRAAIASGDPALAESARMAAHAANLSDASEAAARWCDALLADDPDRLADVAAHLRDAGRRAQLASALEDTAVAAAHAGRRDAASRLAAEALDAYASLEAAADGGRAAERFRANGIRVRRAARPSTGWAALTATERRVAALAGGGCTNPDIARALGLSPRTVETHVSHILAKLGARSRREIAVSRSGPEDGMSRSAR